MENYVQTLEGFCDSFSIARENCTCADADIYDLVTGYGFQYCEGYIVETKFVYTVGFNLTYAILSTIICAVSIFGNSLVLAMAVTTWRKMSTCQRIIAYMSISDLVHSTNFVIPAISNYWTYMWIFGNQFCKIFYTLIPLGGIISIWLIVIVTVERYYGITNPLSPPSTRKINVAVLLTIICCIASVIPETVYAQVNEKHCSVQWPTMSAPYIYYALHLVFTAIVPILLVVVLYTRILATLKQDIINNKDLQQSIQRKNFEKKVKDTQRIKRAILFLMISFAVLAAPYRIYALIQTAHNDLNKTLYYILSYVGRLAYQLHSALHPYLFSAADKRWKRRVRVMWMTCCRRVTSVSRNSLHTSELSYSKTATTEI